MDLVEYLFKFGRDGFALAILYWFARHALAIMRDKIGPRVEQTAEAVARIEPKVDAMHARLCPPPGPAQAPAPAAALRIAEGTRPGENAA